MIRSGYEKIGSLIVSSIMGHSGRGDIFPLNLLPSYRAMANTIREKGITVIAKSATRFEREGNYRRFAPWRCIKQVVENGRVIGLLNSFGLTNKGVEKCARMIKDSINNGFDVIPSYFVDLRNGLDVARDEATGAIAIYEDVLGDSFSTLEYNASCPNSGESLEDTEHYIVAIAKHLLLILPTRVMLIVKLSPLHSIELALELQAIGVHVLHCLNTFPHKMIYPDKVSPLAKYGGGGYSGEFMFKNALAINSNLRARLHIPMIMGCGISNIEHAGRYMEMLNNTQLGLTQNSLAICSVIRTDPRAAHEIIELFSGGSH